METWTGKLLASEPLMLLLQIHTPLQIKQAILWSLPAGLLVSFAVAKGFFLSSPPETRITILTPNALVPPLWFLILTVLSFCWFGQRSRGAKLLRLALFAMAGLMALYGSALLVLLAWVIAGLLLPFCVWRISQGSRRRVIFWGTALGFPTLISRRIVQLPVLRFVRARNFTAIFPAFAALGVVLALNCLTDSVFQTGVGVLIYMVALFTALRASAA